MSPQMEKHETRGRFNDVLVVVLVAACLYGGWKFAPPYYMSWQASQTMKDFIRLMARQVPEAKIENDLWARLESDGFDPENFEVALETKYTPNRLLNELTIDVTYVREVHHPLINKVTTLSFDHKIHRRFAVDW
jgi:hypothetical protein